MYYVYTLKHPDNQVPFYVGMTNDPSVRIAAHIRKQNNVALRSVIRGMMNYGRKPIMDVIYKTNDFDDCCHAESRLIREYAKKYFLLNIKDMYPESDWVDVSMQDRICSPGFRCKKYDECVFCAEIEIDRYTRPVNDYLINGGSIFRYEIGHDDWNATRQHMYREGSIGYVKVPLSETFFFIVSTVAVNKNFALESEMSLEDAIRAYWNTAGEFRKLKRKTTSGVFARK